MKTALLIHYYFPPIHSGAVLRNYYFALELARYFDKVLVITTSNRNILPEDDLPLPNNISIIEAPTFDYRRFIGKASGRSHLPEDRKRSPIFRFFIRLQKTLPFHFFLGEGGLWYIYQAYKQGLKIWQDHDIKLIYSSFGPYADHLIAYFLKNKIHNVKWIADFRDLQVEPLYRNVYFEKLQIRLEKLILRKADLVTTVSEGLKRHLVRYRRPTLAIPRGVNTRNRTDVKHFEKFTICYTGSLYNEYRDAAYFFAQLAQLIQDGLIDQDKIEFIYAGRDGNQFAEWADEYNLKTVYHDYGFLSRKDTLELQNRSHLQLLLSSATGEWTGVFTGKFFEYLESLNPVLVLIKGQRDQEFEDVIKHTGAGIVCYDPPWDKNRLSDYLVSQYKQWESSGKLDSKYNLDFIRNNFSWSCQAEKMLKAVGLN